MIRGTRCVGPVEGTHCPIWLTQIEAEDPIPCAAHAAPMKFDKAEFWKVKRSKEDPMKLVYVNSKGDVSWDIPLNGMMTIEETSPLYRHPTFVALQRATDGWA